MRFEGLRRALRELTGRAGTDFADALGAQLDACLDGARLAHRFSLGEVETAQAGRLIVEIEHRGDARRAELVEALAHALVTPIDREDLFRVSRSIDDVLDNLRDYVREAGLFGEPAGAGSFVDVTGAVVEAIERLAFAVSNLADRPGMVNEAALAAKKKCNDIRRMYELGLAELLDEGRARPDESVRSILRTRELLRRIDIVGLRLGETADALSDGMMKRSY